MNDLVAAHPGFYVLGFNADSDEVFKLPVVAWRIDGGCALPIVVQTYAYPDEWPVLTPEGLVIENGEGVFSGLDVWKYARKHRKEA